MGTISMDKFREDTDKWANEVETLTGPCDIILFPFEAILGTGIRMIQAASASSTCTTRDSVTSVT